MAQPPRPVKRRVVLMLQGHPSRFWGQLGDRLGAEGHRVVKVHFGLGDRMFWGRRAAISYRGTLARWPVYIRRLMGDAGVTDVLYYGDRHPYHVVALEAARALGRRAWVIEHGYLRPDWLTMEPGGMGAFSAFPRSRSEVERLADGRPAPDMRERYGHDFFTEARNEVSFALLQTFGRIAYPFCVTDRAVPPLLEHASWLPELALTRRRGRAAARLTARLRTDGTAYNLVAMQLEADYQIRASSPYLRLRDFLDEVVTSFARHAPPDRHLVVKIHPRDCGLGRWFAQIPAVARANGVAGRVHVVRGGSLQALIEGSRGVVLVNSTVGLHALRAGVPVCATGAAIYDIPGLVHQRGLDRFWDDPDPVDSAFFGSFERALSRIQVKGSFFDPAGRKAAIADLVHRISEPVGA